MTVIDDAYAEALEDSAFQGAGATLGRARKARPKRAARLVDLAEPEGLEAGLTISYHPGRLEAAWLLESLGQFLDEGLITDVEALVKGGKEANVYRCRAHPRMSAEWLAAKVYRPNKYRNLRNDALYREGREVLAGSGQTIKKREHRAWRAINKRTSFGMELLHTSWLAHEFTALRRLREAGAAVPEPVAMSANCILMGYMGDASRAAPTLHETSLASDEIAPLWREALRNVTLLLQNDMVHGDLSAYNILYWQGRITLIDFPQVVDVHRNPSAEAILRRDIVRLCDFFVPRGVIVDPEALTARLWREYGGHQVVIEDLVAAQQEARSGKATTH